MKYKIKSSSRSIWEDDNYPLWIVLYFIFWFLFGFGACASFALGPTLYFLDIWPVCVGLGLFCACMVTAVTNFSESDISYYN
ncbi:hypothetical protein UFOVP67_60 [uncultured Caudovirales phage]|uniref:Uncharacterized protein n=1 Tax=uncultured Caudovirales phage TaxID=2100421 RepID=A0A6J5T904_9CAUD|nr:hypothetical protein UFOVP67_60 [uncultured Caudovirales phage]